MSVIAWDGKTLAADRMATAGCMRKTATKIFKLESGEVLAFSGIVEQALVLMAWFKDGQDPAKWPAFQRKDGDDWTIMVVAYEVDELFTYQQEPVAQPVEDPYMAWGEGREFAMGAMAMGANARLAVEVTSRLCVSCGQGVDAFDLSAKP